MALAPIQVIEGLERGCVYAKLSSPATVGREDDNAIQLNDERVSRFHAKIQEDGGRVILTDLDSTNGTRVNGHPVQMRVLQIGDQLSIGRCLLVYGSREEIANRGGEILGAKTLPGFGSPGTGQPLRQQDGDEPSQPDAIPSAVDWSHIQDEIAQLFPLGSPELPTGLLALQQAQMSDILAYIHDRIRSVLEAASEDEANGQEGAKNMVVDWVTWQRLVALEMDLATYIRKVAEPSP